MLAILQHLLMFAGAAITVLLVVPIWAAILFASYLELTKLIRGAYNNHLHNKFFNKIEEYRNDFA